MFVTARKNSHPNSIDVSRYGKAPWRRLSPFHTYPQACIPLPGTFDALDVKQGSLMQQSRSVEGVWQGLKLIEDETAPEMFEAPARKRRGRPQEHWFGYRLLSYAEAKALIYIPSYLHVLRSLESELVEELRSLANDQEVALTDVSFQPHCLGPRPISHAALLVDYLNGELAPYEAALERLDRQADELADGYSESTARLQQGLPHGSVLELAAERLRARVQDLQVASLTSYAGCATLFEREGLLLTLVRNTGSGEDIEPATRVLCAWVGSGELSVAQARDLSRLAPVCRWSEDWWQAPRSA